jgi:tetratricopeptide (TPR) repeat protein
MIETSEAIEAIDISNKEAWDIVRTEPAKTLEIAKANLERSEELGYEKGIAWSVSNIGAASTWLSDYEVALDHLHRGVDLLHSCGELEHEVQIEYYLSIVFYFLGDQDKQMNHANISFTKAKEIGDIPGQANALNGIGTVHYTNNNNEEAIDALKSGLSLAKEIGDFALQGRIYDGLGNSCLNLDRTEEALEYMIKSLEVLKTTGDIALYCFRSCRDRKYSG